MRPFPRNASCGEAIQSIHHAVARVAALPTVSGKVAPGVAAATILPP
jgi:hypothetical protein